MTQKNRLEGGLINRDNTRDFVFNGQTMQGFEGDTLASALLANDIRLVGRSFKYHRPRGVLSAGSEEPNAMVELRTGNRKEPNSRTTTTELYDGLVAHAQNCWPSLNFDFLEVNDLFAPFLTGGFYYKTFMWPSIFWEKVYEPIIRRAAGLGSASLEPDPDCYDKGFLHADLLIIGAGPAGLAAARIAAKSGVRVIIVDEDFVTGGRLNAETYVVDEKPGSKWAKEITEELSNFNNVKILTRTTIIGAFDHGIYGAVERVSDHLKTPYPGKPRQILWRIYSKQAILCSGATERPIVFENNDRPGIMLAGAVRNYVNRWAVTPSQNVAIFTNNNDGHQTARALLNKGVKVAAVIDTRKQKVSSPDYETFSNAVVSNTSGRLGLVSITVSHEDGTQRTVKCGALGVSGGWNPNIHLSSHHRGRPIWKESIQSFIPDDNCPSGMLVAGSAKGFMELQGVIKSGHDAAVLALDSLSIEPKGINLPKVEGDVELSIEPFWMVKGTSRGWVDQQNDVTAKDIELAKQENFTSVEHLKRYTTLGMATDQGKTANISGLAIMANLLGKPIPEVGTTIYRPPYTPTAIGAFAGRSRDKDFRPIRKTPSHLWAEEKGAVFVEVGMWMRAQWFPEKDETHWRQSVDREVLSTRKSVGVCDVTTLGKVDVQGRDASSFLNFIYCNGFAKLPIGKTRYGLMLREDGIAMDDGTAARLGENHFVVTTTTANAVSVYRHMEFVRQCLFPKMDVQLISTTEAWAQFAVAGPNSRNVLRKIVDKDYDISNDGFPFMACGEVTVCGGLRARLFRISFSGELAYEVAVPTRYGDALIREIMEAGKEFDIVPYGTEALGVMRIEKGHAAGNEINGTTSALNLGMGRMVSKKKDSVGSVLSEREGLNTQDALKLVGLMPVNTDDPVPAGAHLMSAGSPVDAEHDQGYVTSACFSPNLNCHIGLGFLKAGDTRIGEIVRLVSPLTGQDHKVEVVSAHFVDPEGERLRA